LATELNEKVDGVTVHKYPLTNMFLFEMDKKVTSGKNKIDHIGLSVRLKVEHNILTFPTFQNDGIRIVTHRDVTRKDMEITRDSI
jgi:threonine aldolase